MSSEIGSTDFDRLDQWGGGFVESTTTSLDDIRKEQQKINGNILKGDRFLLLKNYDNLDVNGMERCLTTV